MCDDIDEMVEYINEEEENIENIDSSEIKILVEGKSSFRFNNCY